MKQRVLSPMVGTLVAGLVLAGCASAPSEQQSAPSEYSLSDLNEQLVMATAWVQHAAEYKALSYQAFNIARDRLDDALAGQSRHDKPLAVVVDVDETLVDNMAFEAWLVGKDEAYGSERWHQWMKARQATALPGAVSFLQYADRQGVDVYYITNRDEDAWTDTQANLAALGFPQLTRSHLLLKSGSSDKQARRDLVTSSHQVALMMGDNLADFKSIYGSDLASVRNEAVFDDQARFGRRFILLPNPVYGAWEAALYDGDWSLPPDEKSAHRKAGLKAWQPSGTP
ncbi:5'-nucleotidase, lipoprotein e(P4) family [Larsenimonas rhizosphaerae]|uniref:5'-nucleotidase, lipoprotein e(P4) family n=1 Tax=Larsenimonas rhizosphaerae TaxID=2944682 RepID=UPI00203408B1|nr:5'-nucleotidase, lipoprotein e(P4) family [Larsenimonas rhizosphaerae]MCM2131686.1 5'-nucleotidase, lipoprotein e(P4) family [Larsenimonas rhizosphaerae]